MTRSDVLEHQAIADGRGPEHKNYPGFGAALGAGIDFDVAEGTPCEVCGSKCEYIEVLDGGSRYSYAVCTNPECNEAYEF